MNHDYTFCSDFGPECPESCFRAEITADLLREKYNGPVSWANFKGTSECEIPKPTTGVPELLKEILETLQSIDRKMDAPYYLTDEYVVYGDPNGMVGNLPLQKVLRRNIGGNGGNGGGGRV